MKLNYCSPSTDITRCDLTCPGRPPSVPASVRTSPTKTLPLVCTVLETPVPYNFSCNFRCTFNLAKKRLDLCRKNRQTWQKSHTVRPVTVLILTLKEQLRLPKSVLTNLMNRPCFVRESQRKKSVQHPQVKEST